MSNSEVTIYDIARELNVSTATVSRALQGQKGVSKELRDKVQKTADKLGYQRNVFASKLRTRKTLTIGVIIPRIRSEFMSDVIAGIEEEVNQSGYNTIITQSCESLQHEKQNARSLFDNRVDGLLVSLSSETKDFKHFKPYIEKRIPIVFFDRVGELKGATSVIIDNRKASYLITTHLIKKGYERIVHITGSQYLNIYQDRLLGYKDALNENNIQFDQDLIYINDLTKESARDCANQIMAIKQLPDAVYAVNDRVAVCCMKQFKENGLKIPDNIAVAGFNHDFVSQIVEPRLTTIDYPAYEMGKVAAQHLLTKIEGESLKMLPSQIVLHSELITGEST